MVVQLGEGDTGVGGADKGSRRPAARSASDAEPVGSSGVWTRCGSGSEASSRRGGQRRTVAWWCSGGSETAHSVLQTVLRRGGTPAGTEGRGVARHSSSAAAAASGAEERVRVRGRGKEEEKKEKWASLRFYSG
jgi:hypothetical protein